MSKKHASILLGLIVVLLLAACGPVETPAPEPTAISLVSTDTPIPTSASLLTETPTLVPTIVPTPTAVSCGEVRMRFVEGSPKLFENGVRIGGQMLVENVGSVPVSGSLHNYLGDKELFRAYGALVTLRPGESEKVLFDFTLEPFEGERTVFFDFERFEEIPGCPMLLAQVALNVVYPTPTSVPPTDTPVPPPPPTPTPDPLAGFGGLEVLDLPGFEIPTQEEGRLRINCDVCNASGGTVYCLGDFRSYVVQAGSYTVVEQYRGKGDCRRTTNPNCDALEMVILDQNGAPVWSGYVGVRGDVAATLRGQVVVIWNGQQHIMVEKDSCNMKSVTADHVSVCFRPVN